jgi:PAS domain S-box-containing protein
MVLSRLFLRLLSSTLCHAVVAPYDTPRATNVLVLYSFTAREAMGDFEPLKSTLRSEVPGPVNFHVEYLESLRFEVPGYEKGLADSLAATYRGQKIDLVLAAFYPALQFAVDHRDQAFPGAPIVFFSVSPVRIEGRNLWPGVTGVTIGGDVKGTLDLALQLQPNVNNIAIVTGSSPYEHFWLGMTHQALRLLSPGLTSIDIVGLSADGTLNEIDALPSHSAVLFEAIPQESAQPAMGTYDLLTAISGKVPTYCIQKYCLDHGAIGGSYADFSEQGTKAGEVAARVLAGERPESIPVEHGSAPSAHLDWRQLQRWKIPETMLPPGAVVLYRKPGFWQSRRPTFSETILVLIVSFAMLLLVIEFVRHSSQRRKYRSYLREGEDRFRGMTDAMSLLIWMSDERGKITCVNQAALNFIGNDPVAHDWIDRIHPDDLPGALPQLAEAIKNQCGFSKEFRLRRADGEYRWVLDMAAPRLNGDGSFAGLIGYACDITDQRLAQEALRNVGGRLIEAQEKERSRIARELHDDICQKLALLAMELEMSKRACLTPGGSVAMRIEEMRQHCSEIAADVQALSHELHSSRLDYLGLTVALQSFCQEFSQQQNVNVDFKYERVPSALAKDVALSLFRIAQEGLHNSLKYSGADRFSVTLLGTGSVIELEIVDFGEGFDVHKARGSKGLGLISMQERAHLVNGSFAVESKIGGGTRILVTVPLAAQPKDGGVSAPLVSAPLIEDTLPATAFDAEIAT